MAAYLSDVPAKSSYGGAVQEEGGLEESQPGEDTLETQKK